MLHINTKFTVGIFALGVLSACASNENTNAATQAPVDADCHIIGKIQNWQVFDDRHVYVEGAEAESKFLLTTRSMCRAMPNAPLVEIHNPQKPVCNSGSRVAFPAGYGRQTCTLSRIEKVASVDEAMALLNARAQ